MTNNALATAIDLVPLIQELRHETENNRRLAEPIVERIRTSGLARMSLATEFGGLAVPLIESLKVYEALAAAEASVPWILWNCSVVTTLSRHMTPQLRAEVFADEKSLFAQSTRPMGVAKKNASGFTVNGRWSLVSGCELADWLFLTAFVHDDDGLVTDDNGMPVSMFVSVPRASCQIIDTWHTGGLRGTGSHDVELKNESVPAYRTFGFGETHEIDAPVAKLPAFCVLQSIFAAQTMGIAQCALDTVVQMAKTNITPGPMPDLRDNTDAQASVTSQKYALDAARRNLHRYVDELWDNTVAGETAPIEQIRDVYGASMHAMAVAKEIVDSMHALGGTRALYIDSPLERQHRDMHAMLRHIVAQRMWLEDTGRILFDMPPLIPIYLL